MSDSEESKEKDRLPATPTLSRRLFDRDALDTTNFPTTEEERLCEHDKFHTIVARLLHQVLPSATLEDIDNLLETYFRSHGIENEDGLSALSEGDFPSISSVESTSLWKKIIFRRRWRSWGGHESGRLQTRWTVCMIPPRGVRISWDTVDVRFSSQLYRAWKRSIL